MKYDTVHDKIVDESSDQEPTILAAELAPPPTRSAISIDNLIGHTNAISSIINPEEVGDNDTDGEHENDYDFSVANSSEVDVEMPAKERATRKGNRSKKGQLGMPKGFRHLKKSDGEPFWRRDIQYDFLQEIFNDKIKAFTNYFPHCDIPSANNEPKLTFSELYVRTLAESGKCSRILKERLIKDIDMGKSVGKVCLLVNTGRMNTTVNFVPEMRSTLRTYHSIPSLQADPIFGGTKPLQDTPRLKSILKAVTEVHPELTSLDDILEKPPADKPNTNIFQLLFFLSNSIKSVKYLQDESEISEENNNGFMEFFLNSRIHPKNRARRFLWLIYTYLETSFTDDELANNPFNPHVIPPIELIPESEIDDFDKDTDYEIEYSERMFQTRLRYLADEEHNSNPKRGNKSKKEKESMENEEKVIANDHKEPVVEIKSPTKRKAPAVDAKSRKRRGKRNPPVHATTVSSPLAMSVVTSSAETETPLYPEQIQEDKESEIIQPSSPTSHSQVNPEAGFVESAEQVRGDHLEYLAFPVEELSSILKLYADSIISSPPPDSLVSVISRHNVVSKSRTLIKQVKNNSDISEEEFSKKTGLLSDWMHKFFQYKKSTSNGLLGIEWEAIRYDHIYGIEAYIYQLLGKFITTQNLENDTLAESNSTNISSAFEIDKFEDIGFGYVPTHDFNNINEKTNFILDLLSFCHNDFINRSKAALSEESMRSKDSILFNLEREDVEISIKN